jgi:hypothetical protein
VVPALAVPNDVGDGGGGNAMEEGWGHVGLDELPMCPDCKLSRSEDGIYRKVVKREIFLFGCLLICCLSVLQVKQVSSDQALSGLVKTLTLR